VKKKYPSSAKTDNAFLKKIQDKQKNYRQSNLTGDAKASCGKNATCFEKKFAQCQSAWMRYPEGYFDLEYKIIGKVKGGCKIQISEKMDFLGLLAGKQMSCTYNNKNSFAKEVVRIGKEMIGNDKQKYLLI